MVRPSVNSALRRLGFGQAGWARRHLQAVPLTNNFYYMRNTKSINVPITSDFFLQSDGEDNFILADSLLLEVLEPLMENPSENIKNYAAIQESIAKLVEANQIPVSFLRLNSHILNLLLEIREFENRTASYFKQ